MQNLVLAKATKPRIARTVTVGMGESGDELINGIELVLKRLRNIRNPICVAVTVHDFWEDGCLSRVIELTDDKQNSFVVADPDNNPLYIRSDQTYRIIRIVSVGSTFSNEEAGRLKDMLDRIALRMESASAVAAEANWERY